MAVIDSARVKIFFDGEEITEQKAIHPVIAGTAPFLIGGIGTDDYFLGTLDEVRLERVGRSGPWIRLCYENQKENQTLIDNK